MADRSNMALAENLLTLGIAVGGVRARVSRDLELTPQQVELLCSLSHGPRSAGSLAELLACDKTNITGMVNRLESRGLAYRDRDDEDRRVVYVVLSNSGTDVVREFRMRSYEAITKSLGDHSQEERDQLSTLARKAIDSISPELTGLLGPAPRGPQPQRSEEHDCSRTG
ncbi:MarR family winged helix-turn-helix transcriptional regulator [Nocardiopsis sp. YSL2]|uniref:MarR family winged helix-turn-helix transcriptional regulator n=1 Tax=Nocardiopsis sp. YSL2 TaxID=2939492 RepID=UPI0026F47A64|nr:MarR family transcriptional regulator [Nocardiopsis sp. YSL2]